MTTAPEQAKAAGFKNLSEVSRITGYSPQRLSYWHKAKPEKFRSVLLECSDDKAEKDKPQSSHWYCSYCKQKVREIDVTFNQRHDYCRNIVKWVDVE